MLSQLTDVTNGSTSIFVCAIMATVGTAVRILMVCCWRYGIDEDVEGYKSSKERSSLGHLLAAGNCSDALELILFSVAGDLRLLHSKSINPLSLCIIFSVFFTLYSVLSVFVDQRQGDYERTLLFLALRTQNKVLLERVWAVTPISLIMETLGDLHWVCNVPRIYSLSL